MTRICFVCHGNICRSPMAEFIMKDIVDKAGRGKDFFIISAATHDDEIWNGKGSPIYPQARGQLQKNKIPFDDVKRAILLKKTDYEDYDLFICMDDENVRSMMRIFSGDPDGKIRKLLSFANENGDVSDPWYTRDFDRAFADICKGC